MVALLETAEYETKLMLLMHNEICKLMVIGFDWLSCLYKGRLNTLLNGMNIYIINFSILIKSLIFLIRLLFIINLIII